MLTGQPYTSVCPARHCRTSTAAEHGRGVALRVAAPPQVKAAAGSICRVCGLPPGPPRERLLHQRRLIAGQDAVRVWHCRTHSHLHTKVG